MVVNVLLTYVLNVKQKLILLSYFVRSQICSQNCKERKKGKAYTKKIIFYISHAKHLNTHIHINATPPEYKQSTHDSILVEREACKPMKYTYDHLLRAHIINALQYTHTDTLTYVNSGGPLTSRWTNQFTHTRGKLTDTKLREKMNRKDKKKSEKLYFMKPAENDEQKKIQFRFRWALTRSGSQYNYSRTFHNNELRTNMWFFFVDSFRIQHAKSNKHANTIQFSPQNFQIIVNHPLVETILITCFSFIFSLKVPIRLEEFDAPSK